MEQTVEQKTQREETVEQIAQMAYEIVNFGDMVQKSRNSFSYYLELKLKATDDATKAMYQEKLSKQVEYISFYENKMRKHKLEMIELTMKLADQAYMEEQESSIL